MGEFTSLLDLLGALFRLFGLDQSAIFPAVALVIVFFVVAVPVGLLAQGARVRTGKGGMIGEIGTALTDIAGSGRAFVHSEYWNVFSDERISRGTRIRVVSVVGMALKVERYE